jgi:kynurenine formamidase
MVLTGFRVEAYEFTQNEHLGTHMDAPLHFVKNGRSIDEIPMEQLAGNGKQADWDRGCVNFY